MSKKNSIVLKHKNCFSNCEKILNIYSDFKKKILNLKTNKILVAVSGGPDSLALALMCKALQSDNKKKKISLCSHKSRYQKKFFYRVAICKKNSQKTTYYS